MYLLALVWYPISLVTDGVRHSLLFYLGAKRIRNTERDREETHTHKKKRTFQTERCKHEKTMQWCCYVLQSDAFQYTFEKIVVQKKLE